MHIVEVKRQWFTYWKTAIVKNIITTIWIYTETYTKETIQKHAHISTLWRPNI